MTHLRLRQFAVLLTTAGLLAGLPWLATTLTWPTLDLTLLNVEVHLRSARLPEGVATAALITLLWGIWGLYLLALATEALTMVRRRPVHLPLLRPLQLLAATTLSTLVVTPTAAHATSTTSTVTAAPEEPDDTAPATTAEEPDEPVLVERSRTVDAFGYDSAELTEQMRTNVEASADLISRHGAPEIPIVITGHTDAAGDPDYNLALSERRAEAVADALRTHLGEDGVVIETRGEGDQALLEADDDAEQRRVEISYSVVVAPPTEPTTPAGPDDTGTADDSDDAQGPAVGLSLPSGLILVMTTGVAGILTGAAIERRRDLRGQREDEGQESDGFEDNDPTEGASESTTFATGAQGRVDSQDQQDLAILDLARAPGLGITGPGAEGAARTLLARALETTDSDLTIVVPSADLRSLLEDTRRFPLPGEDSPVMVTDTVEDALTLLQLQVLARHRAEDEQAEDDGIAAAQGPQFVLLTRAETGVAAEATSLLAHTDRMPLSAVLLGPWPDEAGATCTLDSEGTITEAGPPFADVVGHRWAPTTSTELLQALTRHQSSPTPTKASEQDDDHDDETREVAPSQASPEGSISPQTSGTVSITVLGRITLAVHGQQVRPHRRAAYEVLAYLAAHPAGARLEAAVDAMWPADASHRGIRRFHDACTAVRTACRPLLGEDATAVITHDGDFYQLNRDLVVCDLWRIDQLLDEADHNGDASSLVTAAAAMFDDDFASQSDFVWAEGVRTRIRAKLVSALTECAKRTESDAAISMLQRALRIEPTAEEAAQELAARYDDKADARSAERVRASHKAALEEAGTSLR
ncbi:OmpA family protein [Nocardiopsis synnemataformans]|uniref:OmpA family protein n=1 Tax=Nocardiopsis synnemataformans TaxID=61305 RepID=UPI003EBD52EE